MSELEQFKKWAASVDMPDAVLPRAWMAWQASADRAQPAQAEAVPSDVVRDADLALDLLAKLFDAYENGPACYEDPNEHAGFLGNAVQLDDGTFHACADLLNRRRPIASQGAKT